MFVSTHGNAYGKPIDPFCINFYAEADFNVKTTASSQGNASKSACGLTLNLISMFTNSPPIENTPYFEKFIMSSPPAPEDSGLLFCIL